jgi:hypothetical protein
MEANKRKTVRSAINGRRNKLTIAGKDPAFEYRIVNDMDNRVVDLQERGYEVVTHEASVGDKRVGIPKKEGSPVEISVGGGKKAYLMRIKKEWYDEDQVAKLQDIEETEKALQATSNGEYGKVDITR